MKRLTDYVRKNPPQNPHQMGMLLWVGRHLPGVVTLSKRRRWTRELKSLQAKDGGWALAHLGGEQWARPDGSPLDQTSDAYATAFSVFALTQAAPTSEQAAIQRGLEWLRENQQASGMWAARSPTKGRKHYISHAATHFAIMAFTELGEVD